MDAEEARHGESASASSGAVEAQATAGGPLRIGRVSVLDALAICGVGATMGLLPWLAPTGTIEGMGGLILLGLGMGAALCAIAAHYRLGSPRLYWTGYDLAVLVFFGWCGASLFLGETPEVTHPALGVAMLSLGGWFVGRLTGWRRFSWLGTALALACVVAAFGSEAVAPGEGDAGSAIDGLLAGRFSGGGVPLLAFALVLAIMTGVFSWIRRPPVGMGGLAVVTTLVLVALHGYIRTMDILGNEVETNAWLEAWRQAMTLVSAYPLAGVGWGAWPVVGEAWSNGRGVLPPPGGDLTGLAVELGTPAAILISLFMFLLPLAAWRSRHTYPFRRMRLSVGLMQTLLVLLLALGFWGIPVLSGPLGIALWTIIGTLAGMFQVRDPARAFGDSLVLPGAEERRGLAGMIVRTTLVLCVGIAVGLPALAQVIAGPPRTDGTAESPRTLERALGLWPHSADLQLRLAEALQRQVRDAGRTIPDVRTAARIESALKAAVAANPYRPQAHEALYFWYRDANDPARALAAIRTGVRYNPASLELRLLLVRELERSGSLALATHHLKIAALRTTGSDQGNLMLQLAELFEQRGLRDQARRWWQYAQQVDDLSAQTQSRLRRLGERLNLLDPPVGRR
jgi:hypothetical protein